MNSCLRLFASTAVAMSLSACVDHGDKPLLLPIWLLTVIYQEKPFQVYINGVTGEVQGARPWSRVKIIVTAVLALILLIAIIAIIAAAKKK